MIGKLLLAALAITTTWAWWKTTRESNEERRRIEEARRLRDSMDCRGFVLPWVLFGLLLASLVGLAALRMAQDERSSSRAYLEAYRERTLDEGAVERAVATTDWSSVVAEMVVGTPRPLGGGVVATRYTEDPFLTDSMEVENFLQVVEVCRGRVCRTVTGHPSTVVPWNEDEHVGTPPLVAWRCLWGSSCSSSRVFSGVEVAASWTLGPRNYREVTP
jgi:hypothetical protein